MRCRPSRTNSLNVVIALLVLVGLQQFGAAALIKGKALLAPLLIERAWSATLQAPGGVVRPWPWADTWPVAWLEMPRRRVSLPVLSGDSGNVLAFAPGHARASAPLGSTGLAVVGGHRDTHFAFLAEVGLGERLRIQLADGQWRDYRIAATRIVDTRVEAVQPQYLAEVILLVTCYPFNALTPNGPLRYVVRAVPA